MGCVGVICPYKGKNVGLLECKTCKGCKVHGAPNEDFPLILRKKFLNLRSSSRQDNSDIQISVTKIIGCLRKHYLELTSDYYMGIEGFKALNFGTAIHNYLEDLWQTQEEKKWGKRLIWTTPKGNKLIGYYDAIDINDRILYDFKTTSYGQFKLKEDKANEHDIVQTTIYATMLKYKQNYDLEGIKITYIGLGDKVCVEFDVPFIDRTDLINNETDFLADCLERKQAPKGGPLAAWECKFCPFAEGCPDKLSKVEEKLIKAQLEAGYP